MEQKIIPAYCIVNIPDDSEPSFRKHFFAVIYMHRSKQYFPQFYSIWSTIHPTGIFPYMVFVFSHRSPPWPNGFLPQGVIFHAMTSKPSIWQAQSQDTLLFGSQHPPPYMIYRVRFFSKLEEYRPISDNSMILKRKMITLHK